MLEIRLQKPSAAWLCGSACVRQLRNAGHMSLPSSRRRPEGWRTQGSEHYLKENTGFRQSWMFQSGMYDAGARCSAWWLPICLIAVFHRNSSEDEESLVSTVSWRAHRLPSLNVVQGQKIFLFITSAPILAHAQPKKSESRHILCPQSVTRIHHPFAFFVVMESPSGGPLFSPGTCLPK